MLMSNKTKGFKFLRVLLFIIGLIMCGYPLISSIIQWKYQSGAVATYNDMSAVTEDIDIQNELQKAQDYNEVLYNVNPMINGRYDKTLSDTNYNSLLNVYGNGVMGTIEIPSISVNLPIYHGTDEEILSVAVGHVKESSLPIGGLNTRTVLTGHRGTPQAKLFTRLDEMVEGDLFYIHVLGETLAYKVTDITTIEPEELEDLTVVEGKDLATLLTCTPYGINTHRLLVTGERTEYVEEIYEEIETKVIMSNREMIFALIPIVFFIIGIVIVVRYIKNKKSTDDKETYESE